jgi:manganese/zinc/iron transport system ATP- binding protein
LQELRLLSEKAIRAEDLVLTYGDVVALARSSFTVPRGQVTTLIGPNGSGKSTLLNAMAGLLQPAAGSIEVLDTVATRVAYVLQTTSVNKSLPVTVREVVTMGRYAGASRFGRLTRSDRAAVTAAIDRMAIGDLVDRHLHTLSGGQRQRVLVAQGLAQDHDILLLDEPLSGVDLPTAQAIDTVIHDEVSGGGTVVMTTHDLSEAQVADHVLLVSRRIVASGLPSEVLVAANLREAYGESLLHVDQDKLFIDDPAHRPVPGRHVHREMSIHTEASHTDPGRP